MTRPTAGLLVLLLLLTGCGGGPGDADDAPSETGTTRALAAAVIDAVSGPAGVSASAAAPLFPRDGVRPSDLGVELAFPRETGDALHVRVVATRGDRPAYDDLRCDGVSMQDQYAGCEEETRSDGTQTVLVWEPEVPESDPGIIVALARRGDDVVQAVAYGPPLAADLGDQRPLADALIDLVADPDIGLETTATLLEEGEAIGDDVWLDWYGQGNGVAAPRGSRAGS